MPSEADRSGGGDLLPQPPGPEAALEPANGVKHGRLGSLLLCLAVFAWPFVFLWEDVLPVNGRYAEIGNDFVALYFKYKIYLLDCLSDGYFPWWSPSEACGFPFYSNPFTAAFYPLNAPLALYVSFLGGYSQLDHQIFTVLGLSIFALGLFFWLRLLGWNPASALFSTAVMSVSFKMTELVRFPNAAHTAAWYPWILYALTLAAFSGSRLKKAWAAMLLAAFTVCFITAGYPYFVYYGIFLFVPYICALLWRPLCARLFGRDLVSAAGAALAMASGLAAALLLCGPYLLAVRTLMSQTSDRSGGNFGYSTSHVFDLEDTLGSLVYPPAASTEGWYFFSITGLLLVVLFLSTSRRAVSPFPGPSPSPGMGPGAKLFLLAWIVLISLITYGRHSYLFSLLWQIMPGFSSLRVWGRMNVILVPVLAWLLAAAFSRFRAALFAEKPGAEAGPRIKKTLLALSSVYGAVLITQACLYLQASRDEMWVQVFGRFFAEEPWFIIRGAAAYSLLAATVLVSAKSWRGRRWLGLAVIPILIASAAWEMHPVGSRTWTEPADFKPIRYRLKVREMDLSSFGHFRFNCETLSLWRNFSVGVVANWYYQRYTDFWRRTDNENEAREMLLGMKDGTKLFFSRSLDHASIRDFLNDATRYQMAGELRSYDGDELLLELTVPIAGHLSFLDNWDPEWRVSVDGKEVELEILLGTFKSVRVPPGKHLVRFWYAPRMRFWRKG